MKKIIPFLTLFFTVAVLSACSALSPSREHPSELIGSWMVDTPDPYEFTFNSDGTGYRGFIPNPYPIEWWTEGNSLRIDMARYAAAAPYWDDDYIILENWSFTRDGDNLTLSSRMNLTSRQTAEETDDVYLIAMPPRGMASALVGSWLWDEDDVYIYIFNPDGAGARGYAGVWVDAFEWWTLGGNRVLIDFSQHGDDWDEEYAAVENWNFSVSGDRLTLSDPDGEFNYIAMPEQGLDSALLGAWAWEENNTFVQSFNSDGTGFSGFTPIQYDFTWWTLADGRLFMASLEEEEDFWVTGSWFYVIENGILTLTSTRDADVTYNYIKID